MKICERCGKKIDEKIGFVEWSVHNEIKPGFIFCIECLNKDSESMNFSEWMESQ